MNKKIFFDNIFFFLLLLGAFSIIGSSYVGLNGNHVWRQSDAYSQILGFMGIKGIMPLSDFFGKTAIYDMPIYQYLVARISDLLKAEPLVVSKYFNFLFWLILLQSGGLIADKFEKGSAVIFWILVSTSPLFLHYYATPLPDVMAVSLSVMAVAILILKNNNTKFALVAVALFIIAALIKSPIPFVFLVFYGVYLLVFYESAHNCRRFYLINGLVFVTSLVSALTAEAIRKVILNTNVAGFSQDPVWYFGTFKNRINAELWHMVYVRITQATSFRITAIILFVTIVIYIFIQQKNAIRNLAPFIIAFFSGWLTFTNLYYVHDYYQLPSMVVFFVASSIVVHFLIKWLNDKKWVSAVKRTGCSFSEIIVIALVLLTPFIMLKMPKISKYETENIYDSIRYALRDLKEFVWITDQLDDPIIGGLTKTKFKVVNKNDLEKNCEQILSSNTAVLINGESSCLKEHKVSATTYIEDAGYQLYVNKK